MANDSLGNLREANGQVAWMWAQNEDLVHAVRRFVDYLDEPEDKPGDREREVELQAAVRDALQIAEASTKEPMPRARVYIQAPAMLAVLKTIVEEYEMTVDGEDTCLFCQILLPTREDLQGHAENCPVLAAQQIIKDASA